MFTIISPSKTQDFSVERMPKILPIGHVSRYHNETKKIIEVMRSFSVHDLECMMKVSSNIAALNQKRFAQWKSDYNVRSTGAADACVFMPAIVAFRGAVYKGFDLAQWTQSDFLRADQKLGIISGLYGLLSPLTYMQPYRLEMGTSMVFHIGTRDYKNLYAFWQKKITAQMNEILSTQKVLLNLASLEYSKVISRKDLDGIIVDVEFKVRRDDGQLKTIAIYAKQARGMMANWIIVERVDTIKGVQQFSQGGWRYSAQGSSKTTLLFIKQ